MTELMTELEKMNPIAAGSIERWLSLNGIEPSAANVELVSVIGQAQPIGQKVPRLAAHTTVVNGTRYWGNKQAIKKLREKARKLKRSK